MIKKDKFLNGPVNVVRLEGTVKNTKKIIYILFDVHNENYECDNINSIDINKYIYKIINKQQIASHNNNNNIIYDLFLETSAKPELNYHHKGNDYLANMRRLFTKLHNLNKIEPIKNLRLHFFDIRDVLFGNLWDIDNAENTIKEILFQGRMEYDQLENITNLLNGILATIEKCVDLLNNNVTYMSSNEKINKEIDNDFDKETIDIFINNLIYKIKNKYNDEKIKNKMNNIIKNMLIVNFNKSHSDIKKLINNIPKIFAASLNITKLDSLRKFEFEFMDLLYENYKLSAHIANEVMSTFASFIDIYFLRRFLDKEYINHAIHYSGGFHSTNTILLLIKDFNFKITNIANNPLNVEIKDLHEIIKKSNRAEDIDIYFVDNNMTQCSNIKGFPKNFM